MVSDRHTVVLYPAAICNLNCRYCYIDKNPALIEIDKLLDESFAGNYYDEFIEEMFPDPNQLTAMEFWGGEPFLGMRRVYNTVRNTLSKYPNLNSFFSSTNMAFPTWNDEFFGLMKVFSEFPDRPIRYCLQISLDGPHEYTDETRGVGTTQALLTNYHKFLMRVGNDLAPNITLTLQFKPTLDITTLRKLNGKKAIIDYYHIFDDLITEVRELEYSNVFAMPGIPNMGVPCLATRDDGEFFAKVCRMCRELEKCSPFQAYPVLTPFAAGNVGDIRLTIRYPNFTCGTGYTTLGLLPNRMISTCHNGFVDLIGEYKQMVTANHGKTSIDARVFMSGHNHRMVFPASEYYKYEGQMMCFNCQNTSARVATIAAQIMLLAHAGQVLPRYQDHKEATKAAIFYQSHTAFCVRDNHTTTGSLTTIHNGMLRLLFNGAHQLLEGEVNWV